MARFRLCRHPAGGVPSGERRNSHASTGGVTIAVSRDIATMIAYTSANAPRPRPIQATDVGNTAAVLCSPLAAAITGSVVYVDNGYHAMGMAVADTKA